MRRIEFGYARVSTTKQDLNRQIDALIEEGIRENHVYVDKRTGANSDRDGLRELFKVAEPGDRITVYTLDRLGRNLREVLNMVHQLNEKGIHVRSLKDPMPVDTSQDDAMAHVAMCMLALFAEMERVFANERAAHARAVREKSGKKVGRKRAHSDELIRYALHLHEQSRPVSEITTETGIARATLYRYIEAAKSEESAR